MKPCPLLPVGNGDPGQCGGEGFGNVVTNSASHTVELFQPSVSVEKTGDDQSKIGDDVTYNIKITNISWPKR